MIIFLASNNISNTLRGCFDSSLEFYNGENVTMNFGNYSLEFSICKSENCNGKEFTGGDMNSTLPCIYLLIFCLMCSLRN